MLTKVFIQLLESPVKPEHPIEFICENLGSSIKQKVEIDMLKQQVQTYRQQVEDLKKQLEDVQKKQQIDDIAETAPTITEITAATADSAAETAKEVVAVAVAESIVESNVEESVADAKVSPIIAAEPEIVAAPKTDAVETAVADVPSKAETENSDKTVAAATTAEKKEELIVTDVPKVDTTVTTKTEEASLAVEPKEPINN